jgi:hypothetical protein
MENTKRDFSERHPDSQEAILFNIFCDVCGKVAAGPLPSIDEYEEDRHIFVEATCAKCNQRVRIDLADVP